MKVRVFGLSFCLIKLWSCAAVAQLVEQLICNHQVEGSSPFCGTVFLIKISTLVDFCNNLFHVAFLLWVTVPGAFLFKALI